MKGISITVLAALAALTNGQRVLSLDQEVSIDIDSPALPATVRFNAWKSKFAKVYANAHEEAEAMENFATVDDQIQKHNRHAHKHGYSKGHNQFSDIHPKDFKDKVVGECHKTMKLRKRGDATHVYTEEEYESLKSSSKDWVKEGKVTAVKNQGQCGSCWSFSTTGSVEGNYAINSGKLVSLSEQKLVDCDTVDHGCSGGLMDNAFNWIKSNGGLPTEASYPYTAANGNCKKVDSVVTITGHTDVTSGDEKALLTAVDKQPVSIAIEADQSVFQSYRSGVIKGSAGCGTQLDHGVLIVGYGTENGVDYWKVKNSWGETWGDEGYVKLERGKNVCGISQQPSYPTGAKAVGPSPPGPSPPSPTPSPPSPSGSHYEDPYKGGCRSDEIQATIQGVDGEVCLPKCTGIFKMGCPKDVPAGVTATPQCAIKDQSGNKYCILTCTPGSNTCGADASCKSISGVGLCTYDK